MNKKPIPANLSLIRAAAGKKGGSVKSKRKADAARSNLDGNRKGPKPKPEQELSRSGKWRRAQKSLIAASSEEES